MTRSAMLLSLVLFVLLILSGGLLSGCAARNPPGASAPAQSNSAHPGNVSLEQQQAAVAHILPLYRGSICLMPARALHELEQVLASPPDNAWALGLQALAQSQIDRHDAAFNAATRAVTLCPAPRLYAWRALTLLRAGRVEQAARDAAFALEQDPQEGAALLAQGLVALRQGRGATGCHSLALACARGECSGLEGARITGQCPEEEPLPAQTVPRAAPARATVFLSGK